MIKLYNDDCINIMKDTKKIKDKSIDLIIADPPYNISRDSNLSTLKGSSKNTIDFGEWDYNFNQTEYIKYFPRILKENANIIIFNAWQNLQEINIVCMESNITIKRCLVVNKLNPLPLNRDCSFINNVEFALWGVYNSKNKPTKWTFNRVHTFETCCMNTYVSTNVVHPTSKSLEMIKYLVTVLSNKGDLVLDPFLGSGTTGIACDNLGRDFIGIEKDKKYYDYCKKTLEVQKGSILDIQNSL